MLRSSFAEAPPTRHSFAALRRAGLSRRRIDDAVRAGALIRVRKGSYVDASVAPELIQAARLGGRLDCISLLRLVGVFVLERSHLHVQFDIGASRLPPRPKVRSHWRATDAAADALAADLIEALAQACRCQPPRAAIATLDSALHRRLVTGEQIGDVFARLPERYRVLRAHLDRRSEAGSETLMRLMLRQEGCAVEVQVRIRGVGRVDLLVDGWLIIECDSREYHGDSVSQLRDRGRDLAAATLGYATFRVLAEDVMYRPDDVRAAVRGLLAARRNGAPGTTPHSGGPECSRAAVRRVSQPVRHRL